MAFKSREDYRKGKELEEARKPGIVPSEVDEDGNEINPHIPQYMSNAPWYLKANKPSLKHQKKWRSDPPYCGISVWYDRGAETYQADRYRKGACENCGAITHDAQSCMERTRLKGARWTNLFIVPDEKIECSQMDYVSKRDRWNGCDLEAHACQVIQKHDALEEARRRYKNSQRLKKLEKKSSLLVPDGISDEEDGDDASMKVDERKQMYFARGGSTGTVRNLRIREDTAKYLLNLDLNSAHYDPKTRSMREDPLPDSDPHEKFYQGDNQHRTSGLAMEFKHLNIHAYKANEKGQDMHLQAAPSQAELSYKSYKISKEDFMSTVKDTIMQKYGNAAAEAELPKELLLGQSERQVEYDRAGRIVKGERASLRIALPRSKYEENVTINNHTSVWGSWWKDHAWGYKCCEQTIRNSYCTGAAGIMALTQLKIS
ncbi:hypothetical protein AQUCO_02100167v1 [Aquilegia coerulea]|uniref:Pre-mRNA-splicing factor SLU7 n=1 Tax=Aquilegia coerulea TaxID=218851 RepID=A0A2G5DFX1_AQUCA|nr:hypothetical protein AQUCO_02100167v1 [Aquilegia coerulea]